LAQREKIKIGADLIWRRGVKDKLGTNLAWRDERIFDKFKVLSILNIGT